MTAVEELDPAGLQEVLGSERRAVLVDFHSPWCAPCRSLRRQLERLAGEHAAAARIVAVNVEVHAEVGRQFEVGALPSLILFRDGLQVHRFSGPTLPSEIAARLQALVPGP